MLAQSFMSADDLGIEDKEKDALIKTLVMLETGKLEYVPAFLLHDITIKRQSGFCNMFNMGWWDIGYSCGSVCCIGGTAELIGELETYSLSDRASHNQQLYELFFPKNDLYRITTAQAARALRSYLTIGEAKWDEAVKSE